MDVLEVFASLRGQSNVTSQTPVLRYSEEPDRMSKNPALRSNSEPASLVSAILVVKPLFNWERHDAILVATDAAHHLAPGAVRESGILGASPVTRNGRGTRISTVSVG